MRRPATEADYKGEDFIVEKLQDFGFSKIEKQPYQIIKWEADEWNLSVNGKEVPCFYTPNTGFTGDDGIQTEIVYLGDGNPEDFEEADVEGKIVLMETRFPNFEKELLKQLAFEVYDPDETLEKFQHPATYLFDNWWKAYRMACENNAAGIVSVLTDYPTNENRLQIPYYGPLNEELPEIVPELFEIPRNTVCTRRLRSTSRHSKSVRFSTRSARSSMPARRYRTRPT